MCRPTSLFLNRANQTKYGNSGVSLLSQFVRSSQFQKSGHLIAYVYLVICPILTSKLVAALRIFNGLCDLDGTAVYFHNVCIFWPQTSVDHLQELDSPNLTEDMQNSNTNLHTMCPQDIKVSPFTEQVKTPKASICSESTFFRRQLNIDIRMVSMSLECISQVAFDQRHINSWQH